MFGWLGDIKTVKKLIIGLLIATALFAQDQTKSGRPTTIGTTTIPVTPTVATGLSIYIDYMYIVNKSASTVTITMTDQSTNCNGGTTACTILPAVTIAANTIYTINTLGVYAQGGIVWQASAANAIDAWVSGRY